jgi:hypothetical protein
MSKTLLLLLPPSSFLLSSCGGGELGLFVGTENDSEGAMGLEHWQAGLQEGELLSQAVEVLRGARLQVAKDGVGFTVQTLAGDAAQLGVVCDVAVAAEEDSRGTGKAVRRSYHAHGGACGHAVGGSSALFQELPPHLSAPTAAPAPVLRKSRKFGTFSKGVIGGVATRTVEAPKRRQASAVTSFPDY